MTGRLERLLGVPGDALDAVVGEKQAAIPLAERGGVERDGQPAEYGRLMLVAPAQGPLGLELLATHPQILQQELLLGGGLLLDLLRLTVKIDENLNLRFQNEGMDRLEDVVDRTGRVPAENVDVVLVVSREKQDRYA